MSDEDRQFHIKLGSRRIDLPRSRALRLALGFGLILGGLLGFLPILGFWMLPLGVLILAVDIAIVRQWRRRFVVWWGRRNEKK
jgi:hypothetical protein